MICLNNHKKWGEKRDTKAVDDGRDVYMKLLKSQKGGKIVGLRMVYLSGWQSDPGEADKDQDATYQGGVEGRLGPNRPTVLG